MLPITLYGVVLNSDNLSSKKLKRLKPVLSKWIELINHYSETFPNEDACYWHTERTNVGILASAAWNTSRNWVALEEFSTLKKRDGRNDINGRCDLYLAKKDHKESIAFEAKQAWPGETVGIKKLTGALASKLDDAWDDAAELSRTDAAVRVAACFVVPRFHRRNLDDPQKFEADLKKWVKDIKSKVSFDGMAWVFPKASRGLLSSRDYLYPGVCLLLQVRRRGN